MVKTQTKYLCGVCNSAFDEIKETKKHEEIPLKGKILPIGLMYLDEVEGGYKSAFYIDHCVENGKTEDVRRIWPCRVNIVLKNSLVDRCHNIGYITGFVDESSWKEDGKRKSALGISTNFFGFLPALPTIINSLEKISESEFDEIKNRLMSDVAYFSEQFKDNIKLYTSDEYLNFCKRLTNKF